jgi:hypothetical protein
METGVQVIGHAARPAQVKHRRYELAGWEFKPDKQGYAKKRAILRQLPSVYGSRARRGGAGIEADRAVGRPYMSREGGTVEQDTARALSPLIVPPVASARLS